jgi:hypothetical protein
MPPSSGGLLDFQQVHRDRAAVGIEKLHGLSLTEKLHGVSLTRGFRLQLL